MGINQSLPRLSNKISVATVFLVSMLLTVTAWHFVTTLVDQNAMRRFENETMTIKARIKDRISSYEQVLRGGRSLFYASSEVSREEWFEYINSLDLEDTYPGIQGIGVSLYLKPNDLSHHIQTTREQSLPDYSVRPKGDRPEYSSIIYMEPNNAHNQKAIGFDMYSEPVRREAMMRARDTGRPAMSGIIELDQEMTDDIQAGFLLYLPLYTSHEFEYIPDRRATELIGWIFSPFRVIDLMQGIASPREQLVNFSLHDGASADENQLLYDGHINLDSSPPLLSNTHTINVAGQHWTIRFSSTPNFEATMDFTFPKLVLTIGSLVSVLLAMIYLMFLSARAQARQLNQEIATRFKTENALSATERYNQSIIESSADYMCVLNLDGEFIDTSKSQKAFQRSNFRNTASYIKSWLDLWCNKEKPLAQKAISSALAGQLGRFIGTSLDTNAKLKWWDVTVTPIADNKNRPEQLLMVARDITAQREAEQRVIQLNAELEARVERRTSELKKQEALNSLLLENLTDAVIACDSQGNIILFNATARNWFGEDPSAIPKEEWGKYYNLYDAEGKMPLALNEIPLLQALRGKRVRNTEMSICPDGVVSNYIQANASPLYDGNELVGAMVIMHDITELRRNAQRIADLFELAPDAILMVDINGQICQVNHRAEQLFGWNRSEMIGHPVEMLLPDAVRDIHKMARNTYLKAPASRAMVADNSGNLQGLRSDGSMFVVDISLSPVESDQGINIAASIRDVTERIAAEKSISESMAVINSINDGAFIFEPDTLKFSYVNEGAVRQLGYSQKELLTMTPIDIEVDLTEHKFLKKIEPLIRGEIATLKFETMHTHHDGHEVPVETTLQYIVLPDGSAKFIALVRDVSERHHVMAELHQTSSKLIKANQEVRRERELLTKRVAERTEELRTINSELEAARDESEQANRAKSAFLAAMSHEIRTPMNGVIGMVEVLSHSELNENQTDAVKTIRESSFSLLSLIDDILDFSKIEAGKLALDLTSVSVDDIAESVCLTLESLAENKGVVLTYFIDPNTSRNVIGDPTRIRQILYNLIGNAIKFSAGMSDRTGRVSLRITSDKTLPKHPIIVTITDNGIGMSAEVLPRLFTSFTQAEASTTRRFGGTGLGLAISDRLVDLMDGDISVHSELDKGSVFTVTLPLEIINDEHATSSPSTLEGVNCIAVNSEYINMDDIRIYLEHAGAAVSQVNSLQDIPQTLTTDKHQPIVIYDTPDRDLSFLKERPFDVPFFLISRGRRKKPRSLTSHITTLDGSIILPESLIKGIAIAAGLSPLESPRDQIEARTRLSQKTVTAPSITQARDRGQLILIAEDDPINQKVILRQLSLLGYVAEIASDGEEALNMWRKGDYALLLSDVHMPKMDGYSLAKSIRQEEINEQHIPILGLTANALRGESVRAKEAGMDEYLTKPIQLDGLAKALTHWLPKENDDSDIDLNQEGKELPMNNLNAKALDVNVLKALVGDDDDVIEDFLTEYLSSANDIMAELDAEYTKGDLAKIGSLVHRLKSTSRSVGAMPLGDLSADIENACKANDKERVKGAQKQLSEMFNSVKHSIMEEITE